MPKKLYYKNVEDGVLLLSKTKESFTREEVLQIVLRAIIENYDNLHDWFNKNF